MASASSSRPWENNHRGDSGMNLPQLEPGKFFKKLKMELMLFLFVNKIKLKN